MAFSRRHSDEPPESPPLKSPPVIHIILPSWIETGLIEKYFFTAMSGREKKKKSSWRLNTIFCLLRMGCDRVDDLRPCPAVRKIMPHALDQ